MKRYITLSALLVFNALTAHASANKSPQEIAEMASNAVVYITTRDADGKFYQGTGFICDPKGDGVLEIVTNAHVMEAAAFVKIETQDGKALLFDSYCGYDKNADITVMNFGWGDADSYGHAALLLADYRPTIGQHV